MRLYDLKINHLQNPLGFRMERTVFSWKVADAKGVRQESARILVALDKNMEKILFDSGFDGEMIPLGYQAKITLQPRTRYYWTVTVRTDAGEEETGQVRLRPGNEKRPGKGNGSLVGMWNSLLRIGRKAWRRIDVIRILKRKSSLQGKWKRQGFISVGLGCMRLITGKGMALCAGSGRSI